MSVTVVFSCGGCDATVEGTKPLAREFRSFSGRSWGIGGSVDTVKVDDVVPEGWVAFDPYTYATYCPKCWGEIVDGIEPAPPPAPGEEES